MFALNCWKYYGIREKIKELDKETKIGEVGPRKPSLCSTKTGIDVYRFAFFLIFFLETRLFKEQFRLLNHLIRISINIVMIFGR